MLNVCCTILDFCIAYSILHGLLYRIEALVYRLLANQVLTYEYFVYLNFPFHLASKRF